MKSTLFPVLTALALSSAAHAGSDYSAKAIPTAAAPSCLWTWFAGGSAGYLSGDWDEDIYTMHVGAELTCAGSNASHAVYLEVGYTEKQDNLNYGYQYQSINAIAAPMLEIDYEVDIVPITLNYKYEQTLTDSLNWYIGAGAGIALYDAEADSSYYGHASKDDTVFYAHIFAGITYNITPAFEVFSGVRYVFMDDPGFFDDSDLEDDLNPDGDLHIELGGRYNF
ncbi:outer membrane beta-barrel protein [Verrucomicrobiaceae bacterium 5K15]|uniref:Outer membrane beta-barrel protein n=1 Tax=Oceaniferula flava TaxID=2800421 RepID=A0AAE2SDH0_9BACT|nr:hypothetical protein [Oceaniferula flavus]MBK1856246.1 outer membrane beta-barrel protein [Oceaniferula flavus]MBM1137553.1 outer membrane beta-barrel protein [Oceaniferula flavus]